MNKEENHIWEGLKEYQLKDIDDFLLDTEEGIKGKATLLQKLKINEYLVIYATQAKQTNTSFFQDYIQRLRELGIDVGKGDAKYGFKMPLPNKKDTERKLIVFRRK